MDKIFSHLYSLSSMVSLGSDIMKMLICLHGNPLNGLEFDSFLPELESKGYQPIIHKRPLKGCVHLEPLIQSINATAKVSGGAPFGILAYSWGAYLALAYLRRFPENVTGVLLVNPLLEDRKPLSLSYRMLLCTPLLRSIVLRLKRRKLAMEYIDRIFFPEIPSDETRKSLLAFLSHGYIWKGAAAYKKLMLKSPLTSLPSIDVPVRVLFGEKDEVAPKPEQMPCLQMMNQLHLTTLPQVGHALPWTRPSLIVDEICRLP